MTDAESTADWAEFSEPGALRARLLDAALPHAPFDGWSPATLAAAARDAGVSMDEARQAFPRDGLDMALALHARADRRLREELEAGAADGMKIREKIAFAVRRRLEIVAPQKEAVRRAATLFALPTNAPHGARALWGTADAIWSGIGDRSEDGNWYSKRAILSGVYSATALYWLGDSSPDSAETWGFLDRRIEGVMQFEKTKAAVNDNPLGRLMMTGPNLLMKLMRPPARRGGPEG